MIEIEIKQEGVKCSIEYHPVSEFRMEDAMQRNGWTVKRLAERLGYSVQAIRQMIEGSPSLNTIYKLAWAMSIDPREMFFRVDTEGNIVEEPKPNDEELRKAAERKALGPLFEQMPQDAQEVLMCPKCGTRFLVQNVPKR